MRTQVQRGYSDADPASAGGPTAPLQVRWLATSCGLPADGPLPRLASALVAQGDPKAIAHIGRWARNPDAGSNFARALGFLMDIPDAKIAAVLADKGYDGLLYADKAGIAGHSFFQRHGSELHLFAVWLADRGRDGKFMATIGFDFLAYASAQAGIRSVRLGSARSADRVLAPLKAVSASLKWRVRRGRVDFSHDQFDARCRS